MHQSPQSCLEETQKKDGIFQWWVQGRPPSCSPARQCRCAPEWHLAFVPLFLGQEGLTRGRRFALITGAFAPPPQGAGWWPCPGQELLMAEHDAPTWHSLAKQVVCCQSPGPAPDPLFAQLLMNSAKKKSTQIMNWAGGNKVLQINDKETRTMYKKTPGRGNATRSLMPVNKFLSKRGPGFWIVN